MYPQNLESIDVYCFGHVLYEMSFGNQLTSATCDQFPPECPAQIRESDNASSNVTFFVVCSVRSISMVSLLLSYWLFFERSHLTCSDLPATYGHTHPIEFLLCPPQGVLFLLFSLASNGWTVERWLFRKVHETILVASQVSIRIATNTQSTPLALK